MSELLLTFCPIQVHIPCPHPELDIGEPGSLLKECSGRLILQGIFDIAKMCLSHLLEDITAKESKEL